MSLDRSFADNTNSWELGPDGVWSRRTTNGDEPRSLQGELMQLHAKHAAEAAAVSRLVSRGVSALGRRALC